MALKSTIYKANLQIADMDRQIYGDHVLTLALHPSETEERLLVRLLAFALNVTANDQRGQLVFARGLADSDEPDLWQKDLTDQLVQWIEVGQPDDRRLMKACGRSEQVKLYCYAAAAPIWWAGIETKLTRLRNLEVWRLPAEQSQALAALAQRSLQWQISIQDGQVYVSDATRQVEIQPIPLWRGGR